MTSEPWPGALVRARQVLAAAYDPPLMPPIKQVRANVAHEMGSHPEHHFLECAFAQDHRYFATRRWHTGWDANVIPGERLLHMYADSGYEHLIIHNQESITLLLYTTYFVRATAAGSTAEAADRALDEIEAALPPKEMDDGQVPVTFWWQDHSVSHSSRSLPTLEWDAIAPNYTAEPQSALAELSAWNAPPLGGRLLICHGEPGTGKTTALRHLAGSWRDWAEFHFITDPERFLRSSSYLIEVVAVDQESRRGEHRMPKPKGGQPWRVIVLEDAGEFLAPDAKHEHGQSISRLLNVCDGILGQAMQSLVLLTTNEPLRHLDPALTRPGRLLRSIEFERFEPAAADDWLHNHGHSPAPSTISPQTLAELYAIIDNWAPSTTRQAQAIGFAA